jgi:hypothetical protein
MPVTIRTALPKLPELRILEGIENGWGLGARVPVAGSGGGDKCGCSGRGERRKRETRLQEAELTLRHDAISS